MDVGMALGQTKSSEHQMNRRLGRIPVQKTATKYVLRWNLLKQWVCKKKILSNTKASPPDMAF